MTDTVLNQRHGAWIRVFVMVVKAQRVQEDFVHRNQSGANKTACAFNFKTTQGVLFKMSPRKCKNMTNEASVYDAHFLFFFPFFFFFLSTHSHTCSRVREQALRAGDSPLTVRCTQLPLWKVSYCCSSIRTLHSYQPWSSERTGSICREAFPWREALPADRGDEKPHNLPPCVGPSPHLNPRLATLVATEMDCVIAVEGEVFYFNLFLLAASNRFPSVESRCNIFHQTPD